jgi:hypothetical protein
MKKYLSRGALVVLPATVLLIVAGSALAAALSYSLFGEASVVTVSRVSHHAKLVSDASPGYGGVDIAGFPSDPADIDELSFDYNPNKTGASGGSPRLVVSFDDGGHAELRPVALVAGAWTTIDGMVGNNWDNHGGTCGFLYATTWAGVLACHAGASIDGMWVVSDSGWAFGGELTVLVDNINVDGKVITFSPQGGGRGGN